MAIYFVQNTTSKAIKIGYSGNVKGRMRALRTASADQLRLLGTIDGDKVDEHRIHLRFAADRLSGEWFRPSGELNAFIRASLERRGGGKPAVGLPTLKEACDLISLCVSAAGWLIASSSDLKFSLSAVGSFGDEHYIAIGGIPDFRLLVEVRDIETGFSAIALIEVGSAWRNIVTTIAELVADVDERVAAAATWRRTPEAVRAATTASCRPNA